MKRRKRRDKNAPAIGGMEPAEDQTKQGRKRRAKRNVAEMAKVARRELKIPTGKEVQEIGRTKEK